MVLIIFLYVEQKILKPEKCLIVVSFIGQVQQIVEKIGSSLGKMSIFFAVLSTIDPDQFIFHVQTPVAEFETPPLQVKWSRNEVLFLLSLYKERENIFKDKKSKKKTLLEEISKEMQEKGYGYSGAQCETKFKNLKQNFTKTVDHNNVSGNEDHHWATKKLRAERLKGPGPKGLFRVRSLADLFNEYQREQREKEEEKEKHLMEMHQQKMQRFDRLLELYKKGHFEMSHIELLWFVVNYFSTFLHITK